MKQVRKYLENSAPSFLGYSNVEVARRITQLVLQRSSGLEGTATCFEPILSDTGSNIRVGEETPHWKEYVSSVSNGHFKLNGLQIKTVNSIPSVTLNMWFALRHVRSFMKWWFTLLYYFLITGKPKYSGPATTLANVGQINYNRFGSDTAFKEFLRAGPIPRLNKARHIYLTVIPRDSGRDSEFLKFRTEPLISLLEHAKFSCLDKLRYCQGHTVVLFLFISFIIFRPSYYLLLSKDLAFNTLVRELNRRNLLEAVFITNAEFLNQPMYLTDLPKKNFSLHLINYSAAIHSHAYNFDRVDDLDQEYYSLSKLDEVWCWIEPQAQELGKLLHPVAVHVMGPMLWYLPQKKVKNQRDDVRRVLLFDVVPQRLEKHSRESSARRFIKYANIKNCKQFIDDIVQAAIDITPDVELAIKHKRPL